MAAAIPYITTALAAKGAKDAHDDRKIMKKDRAKLADAEEKRKAATPFASQDKTRRMANEREMVRRSAGAGRAGSNIQKTNKLG